MNKTELLNKINELEKELWILLDKKEVGRKFDKVHKEYEDYIIEYNKQNNVYYHEEKWVYDVVQKIISEVASTTDLKGNDLTKEVAMRLNKVDGIALEEKKSDGKLNYSVCIITPYSIYHYWLSRGYGRNCSFDKAYNFKSKAAKIIPSEHIIELVYNSSMNELREFEHIVVDKVLNI